MQFCESLNWMKSAQLLDGDIQNKSLFYCLVYPHFIISKINVCIGNSNPNSKYYEISITHLVTIEKGATH